MSNFIYISFQINIKILYYFKITNYFEKRNRYKKKKEIIIYFIKNNKNIFI
jgi:hypothetical protein